MTLKANINKPVKFESAGFFIADKNWIHNKRIIDSYEILVVVKGILYMEQEGIRYSLNKNDILLLHPGIVHKGFEKVEKDTSFYWMHFLPRGETSVFNFENKLENVSLEEVKNFAYVPTFLEKANLERINVLCSQLCHINESKYISGYATDYMITSLVIEISEQFLIKKGVKEAQGNMEKIFEWIRINACRGISLSDVAYEFNYSKEYLSRRFHEVTGVNMQKYINTIRISKAKELLCHNEYKIKEVSNMVGFNDTKYFFRLFQKFENLTPKQFRNAYSKTHYNKK